MLGRLKIEEGWFTLLLVWGLVMTAAAAILNAELINGLEFLPLITTVAILAGIVLAKSKFSARSAHMMALVYGLFLVTLLMGQFLPGELTWRERIFELTNRQIIFISKALSQRTSRDGLIFVIHTSAVFWLLGYTAAWYTFRKPRIWRAILPSGLVLLSVVYYYFGPKPLALYLALFTLVALIYIARTHLVAQEQEWRSASVRYEKNIRFNFLQASLLASILALGLAWGLPTAQANTAVSNALGESGVSDAWHGFQDNWTRLFSSLRSYGSGTNDAYRDTLSLGGPRSVDNTLIMDIYVPQRLPFVYWQAVVYDTYEGGGWSFAEGDQVLHFPDDGAINIANSVAREEVVQTFINYVPNSGTLYAAPEPINSDHQMFVTQSEDGQGNPIVHVTQSRFVLRQGEEYQMTSMYSTADATSLRQASTVYPDWLLERYLQVPDSITPEVIQLAEELTAEFDNPFDKSIVVRNYLRNNIGYNDQIDAPPDGVEPVHYILFDRQEAYCNYYASAMIMMLRSQGIPARFVAGYAQGEWDDESNSYRVRASNAHAWVEVFFPGYGWIQFEPTAALPAGDRPEGSGNPGDRFSIDSFLEEQEQLQEGLDSQGPEDVEPRAELIGDGNSAATEGLIGSIRLWHAAIALIIVGLATLTVIVGNRLNRQVESSVVRSYGRLWRWSGWLGVNIQPAHTPFERANLLTAEVPKGKEPLRNLTRQFVKQRFGPPQTADDDFNPRREWRVLRPLLIRQTIVNQLRRFRDRWQKDK
jgi:transglutaminase-like putative cysteine protease